MLLVPYFLNADKMAELSSVYNALMILLFVFEFGISMSFLRFYQIKKITFLINSLSQMGILLLLLLIVLASFSSTFFHLLNLDDFAVDKALFFLALAGQLSWIFAKNLLISIKNYRVIAGLAMSIFALRIAGFFYLKNIDILVIDEILLSMFIIPFALSFFFVITLNMQTIVKIQKEVLNLKLIKLFFVQLKHFGKFSIETYAIGMLYLLAGRYLIVFLSDTGNTEILADLGYAMTFLGIITIATTSFRTYFVAKFHLSDMKSINAHLGYYLGNIKKYSIAAIGISMLISLIIYLIKPAYLSANASIFAFILLSSYSLIFFLSMITLLSKTMNYNFLELKINAMRLIMVYAICHLFFLKNPIFGFVLINLVMLLGELYFASKILKRLNYVK